MQFTFHHLTDARPHMLAEIDGDRASGRLYSSDRLSPTGVAAWPGHLRAAAETGTEQTLEVAVSIPGFFNEFDKMRVNSKKPPKMPSNAARLLAQNEFNRFYIRAVCLLAADRKHDEVVIYRARHSDNPRPESEGRVNARLPAARLLIDLRVNIGIDTALGLPECYSGLSVRLV
jgi:hypothetical protein